MSPQGAGPQRLRVLHLLPHARKLGGTERTVLDLIGAPPLADVDQRVGFVQPGEVRGFPIAAVLRSPLAMIDWRPDVLHGWLLQGNLLGVLLKGLRPSAALITSERNLGHALTARKRWLERIVARAEDVATGNSSAVRDAAVRRVPRRAARFRVIPPGVAAPPRPPATTRATAVMVGRLHPVKDHLTALRAWRRVVARHPDATLTIVGDGPAREALEATARALGLDAAVTFRGTADPAGDLYGARMFLCSSRAEGFSRATLEALATGLPVISTEVGGVPEMAGDALRVAPVGDDGALATHVLRWLDEPAALEHAAQAALSTAERFAPGRFHDAYAQLYAEATRR